VTFIVGLVYMLTTAHPSREPFCIVGLSVLTHHAVARTGAEARKRLINDFWHQVAWRAPALRAGTMLVVNYAGINYADGSDIVWGPC
jgi:hypothetical protein